MNYVVPFHKKQATPTFFFKILKFLIFVTLSFTEPCGGIWSLNIGWGGRGYVGRGAYPPLHRVGVPRGAWGGGRHPCIGRESASPVMITEININFP